MIGTFFEVVLYQPLLNLLIYFYNVIPGQDIGVAIIFLTILLRLALYPLNQKSLESQKALQEMQPKLEALKKEHGKDQEKLAKEMMKLYSDNKVNPFSSCLPLLIQLPIFIALYQVLRTGLFDSNLDLLYSFVSAPENLNPISFGILDLSKPQGALAVIAGIAQFYQGKMMFSRAVPKTNGSEDESALAQMNKQMMYMMPVMTVIIGFTLPGGLTLYWLTTTLAMLIQQKLIFNKKEEVKVETVEDSK